MNVFVLNTGRCGSTTFVMACRHITNYSSAHESRTMCLGKARLQYPENHIEADNRLSWILGRLDRAYGKDAFYVHLRRDDEGTAESFVKRYSKGIIAAYRDGIMLNLPKDSEPKDVSFDYCDTVNTNIEMFLKDKPYWMDFSLETAQEDFCRFWELVGAEGDLEAALAEFDVNYNATTMVSTSGRRPGTALIGALKKRL